MSGEQYCRVDDLIREGKYEQTISEASRSDGYWPDERYESYMRNLRECLDMIDLDRRIKRDKQ